MRIALTIGVSEYRRVASLPACKRDADAIDDLINETRSFEHRLHLSGELLAQDTKTRLLSFLDNLSGQHISQVLFYFSGHGSLQDGDLLYLLSDFDEKRPHQTSIENDEVDKWLRDLNPDVAVKITDCCHSGISYVKDATTLESAMVRSKGQFSACHFIAASHADEVTYAGEDFSEFTEHVLKGLSERELGTIRYKELADIVLDSYRDSNSQRPYIVQQGGMRDIFFEQTEETRAFLKRLIGPKEVPQVNAIPEAPLPRRGLIEMIEADAKGMITNETASAYLKRLQQTIENLQIDEELRDIYNIRSEFSGFWETEIANEEAIGKWIKKHGGDLFAEPIEEEIKTRVPRDLLNPVEANFNPWGKIESKVDIMGFRTTANLDYDLIRLRLEPKYPNVEEFEAALLLLWSIHYVVLFSYATPLRTVNWSKHELPERIRWKVLRFSDRELEKINGMATATFQEMERLAKDNLLRRFPQRT
jgi:hypothetical protein